LLSFKKKEATMENKKRKLDALEDTDREGRDRENMPP